MKLKIFRCTAVICMFLIFNCKPNSASSDAVTIGKFNNETVKKFDEYSSFIIKFSNLIYEKDGKTVKIPIFQGNKGDVTYKEFRNYCLEKNLLKEGFRESGFIIETKRGELKKKFHEFLKFYKGNILKDSNIDKPDKMVISDGVLDIYYDFEAEGIPFVIQITIYTVEDYFDTKSLKSIFDVNIDENMKTPTPYFTFAIRMGTTSNKIL
ncbi:MAG: hypothetical protein GXY14_09855 [Spirochaetes bacterium]|nr:hypothetical protein [Spirochaetota bacterium]